MKKKLLILAGMFIFFQFGFSMINMEIWNGHREELLNSNITTEEAYQKLVEANRLGYDFYDVYLDVLLKDSDSEKLLEKVIENSKSNAGKIVALQGMYKVNNEKYQNKKKKLRGKVTLFYGCYFGEKNAKRYLEGIEPYLQSQLESE